MNELSDRQKALLKAVVETYIETAEPVGSGTIEQNNNLGVSPATIRNEMVRLTELGYLRKPHSSAGRSPTGQGIKFYIHDLMKPKELSVKDEVAIKEKLWEDRFEFARLMQEATRALASQTHALAVAMTDDDEMYAAGTANILDMPEFFDIDVTREVLTMLDESGRLRDICALSVTNEPIHVILGEDIGQEYLQPIGIVFTRFQGPRNRQGTLGVIGPMRLNYPVVVPAVRYITDLIDEMSHSW
ncbi:MAG: hypothetical protein Q8R11_02550 [bacterium]|nr:hypothetical protein [bacterium]